VNREMEVGLLTLCSPCLEAWWSEIAKPVPGQETCQWKQLQPGLR